MSERQEALQAQQQAQQTQQNLQQAAQQAPSYVEQRGLLEELVEDELDSATVGMLRNMTSRDFILSNLDKAEINEIKKLRQITLKKIYAAHPSEKSIMQGDLREQVYENGSKLKPLDATQRVLIDQYVRGAYVRLARSKDGFQQEELGKTISASETRQPESSSGGGILPW